MGIHPIDWDCSMARSHLPAKARLKPVKDLEGQ
jgi:hypothetical protein